MVWSLINASDSIASFNFLISKVFCKPKNSFDPSIPARGPLQSKLFSSFKVTKKFTDKSLESDDFFSIKQQFGSLNPVK